VFIYRAIWFLRYADAEYYDAYYVRPREYTRWKKIVLRRCEKVKMAKRVQHTQRNKHQS
jgi:hypothetical protein